MTVCHLHGPLPTVAVVLVNYGGWDDTLACLESLHQLPYPYLHVVVVDNASPNDSLFHLSKAHQAPERYGPFQLIESHTNTGFSGGNNLGIQAVLSQPEPPEFIWLLNNDTTVRPTTLLALIRQARRTGGVVGSVLRYPDGRFQQGGIRLNPWTGQLRGYPEKRLAADKPVDAVSGASMLIPTWVITGVGPLPEEYFLYVEDVAYCLQLQRAGVPVTVCPESVVIHVEGASTSGKAQRGKAHGESRHKSWMTQYYYQRNRLAVMLTALPWPQKLATLFYTGFRWCRMVVKALMKGDLDRQRFVVFHRALLDGIFGNLGQASPQRWQP